MTTLHRGPLAWYRDTIREIRLLIAELVHP